MKYIKWIFLTLLILGIIITAILFCNFVNNRSKITETNNDKIKELYDINLYRRKHVIYEDNKLLLDFTVIENGGYIVFDEKHVTYCRIENICDSSNYTYNSENNELYIERDNIFLRDGTYNIEIKEDTVELSIKNSNRKTVYYLDMPKG